MQLPIKDDIDGGSAFAHGAGSAGIRETMIGDGGTTFIGDGGTTLIEGGRD
jgi:hypothetical protein